MVAEAKRRCENLVDIGLERVAVHRAVEQHGRGQAREPERTGEGGGQPAPERGSAHRAVPGPRDVPSWWTLRFRR